jgi:hypothetical protein
MINDCRLTREVKHLLQRGLGSFPLRVEQPQCLEERGYLWMQQQAPEPKAGDEGPQPGLACSPAGGLSAEEEQLGAALDDDHQRDKSETGLAGLENSKMPSDDDLGPFL